MDNLQPKSPDRVAALLEGWRLGGLGKNEIDATLKQFSADELKRLSGMLAQELNLLYAAEGLGST